jgi:catechol 2,3-dioxygenase-like lactoylglutathione lyase family enzyme
MKRFPMRIQRMDHFTIVTDRLEVTREFYAMLGMKPGPRPLFPVPGLWLYLNDHPVLHVLEVSQMPSPRRGVLDHMAFFAEGLENTLRLLIEHNVDYRLIRTPRPFSTWQVFFDDPNGVEVEFAFAASETLPGDLKSGRPGPDASTAAET